MPKQTLDALLRDKAKLRAVLLYHVVGGKVPAKNVVEARSSAKTREWQERRHPGRRRNVFVNGAKVTSPDVMATNGVIHVINRVLIPPAQ